MNQLDCPKCSGAGSYSYDENHGKLCEVCCKHEEFWKLKDGYASYKEGENNNCCSRCGTMQRDIKESEDE